MHVSLRYAASCAYANPAASPGLGGRAYWIEPGRPRPQRVGAKARDDGDRDRRYPEFDVVRSSPRSRDRSPETTTYHSRESVCSNTTQIRIIAYQSNQANRRTADGVHSRLRFRERSHASMAPR